MKKTDDLVNEINETFRNSKKKLSEDLRLYGETQDMINKDRVELDIPWYVFADRARTLEDEVETLDMCLTSTVEHHEAETNALQWKVKELAEHIRNSCYKHRNGDDACRCKWLQEALEGGDDD